MSNTEYIEKMVTMNDFIYADTSTLMDTDFLSPFLEKASPFLMSSGKRITVPTAVRAELIRHFDSPDYEKHLKAEEAMRILGENKELFQTPGVQLEDDDIAEAFADAELLALLMMNRGGRRQLLIANDRNLTRDAFDLNKLQSCQGGRISVCHIDRFGQLQRCSCVTETRQRQDLSGELNSFDRDNCLDDLGDCNTLAAECPDVSPAGASVPETEETIQRVAEQINADCVEATAEAQGKAESEQPSETKNNWWKWLLVFTGGVATGVFGSKIAQSFVCPLAAV